MKIKEPNELSCEGILEYSQYAYLIVNSFVKNKCSGNKTYNRKATKEISHAQCLSLKQSAENRRYANDNISNFQKYINAQLMEVVL